MNVGWALALSVAAAIATWWLVPEMLPEEFYSLRWKLPLPIGAAVFAHSGLKWLGAQFARRPMPTILVECVVIVIVFLPMMLIRTRE